MCHSRIKVWPVKGGANLMACIVLGLCCPLSLQKHKAVSEASWLFCLLLALVLKGIFKDMYDLTFFPPCYQLEVCVALLPLNMFVFLSWQHLLLAFISLLGRLELPTLRLTASRSNQLSYGSLAGVDKVTTHRMGLPSTAFTDGQASFWKYWEWEHIFRIVGPD